MIICFDLDDTLFESNVIMDVVKTFNLDFKRSDIKSWELLELPDYCRAEITKRWSMPEHMCNSMPCDGAVAKLEQLADAGHDLYCITARSSVIEAETKEMVRRWFPSIRETIVVNSGSKASVLAEIKPDLFLDDGPHFILESVNLNINTIMISNQFTPYNHFMRGVVQWRKKIADLGDLEEYESK